MKYSIFIDPHTDPSSTASTAAAFIAALLRKKHQIVGVFFYGHAVKWAFESHQDWQHLAKQGIKFTACSTIADDYLDKGRQQLSYVQLAGMGQWMQAHLSADKRMEFV